MSELFNDLMSSLNEIIAYEQGKKVEGVVVHKLCIDEVKDFTPSEIRQIRLSAKMTQAVFASCVGVTKKAVEAWEGGRSKPDGAARRTIGLFQKNPNFADDLGIIIRK